MSPLRAGLLGIVVLAVGTWFAFAKDVPFTKPYQFTAVFENANAMRVNSPVRIAGVEVGKVAKVEPLGGRSSAAEVTISMFEREQKVYRDARLKIRPRIFLEGNYFVDLRPGTPGARELSDGGTIGPMQTAAPVQVDQVLGTLKSDARRDLQQLIRGYGDALNGRPKPGEDDDQDPATKGQRASESLNDALGDSPEALRTSAIVSEAFRGTEPGADLPRLISGLERTTGGLGRSEEDLKGFVTNFNTAMGAFAAEQDNLRATLREVPQLLRAANPAFDALNDSFPATRGFAREILPGIRQTPRTVAAALPWIDQMRPLVSERELGGLVKDLRPATRDTARFTDGNVRFIRETDRLQQCAVRNLLPTGDVAVDDGARSTGISVRNELFQALVGLAGESQNFDANGAYVRIQTGGGDVPITSGAVAQGVKLFGNATRKPLGTKPTRPAQTPPIRTSVPCATQKRPDLNSAKVGGGP